MNYLRLRKPSPAMVVASLALLIALGGSALAGPIAQIARKKPGDKLIKKHSLSGNRLRNHTVSGAQIQQLSWQALTLQNGWVDDNGSPDPGRAPAVAVDVQGIVHFRGAIHCGTGTTCPIQFATLPGSLAPSKLVRLSANTHTQTTGQINVNTDATLQVFNDANDGSGTQDQIRTALDGVTYALG